MGKRLGKLIHTIGRSYGLSKPTKAELKGEEKKMKDELKKLAKDEKRYVLKYKIEQKKAKIRKLKGPSVLDRIAGPQGQKANYLTDIPDVMGSIGSGSKRSKYFWE